MEIMGFTEETTKWLKSYLYNRKFIEKSRTQNINKKTQILNKMTQLIYQHNVLIYIKISMQSQINQDIDHC